MKRFFKRIIRKIGYRFIRILVPCLVIVTLIFSSCISASALTYYGNNITFDVEYADYYSDVWGNLGQAEIFELNDESFFVTNDFDVYGIAGPWLVRCQIQNVSVNSSSYGKLRISVRGYSNGRPDSRYEEISKIHILNSSGSYDPVGVQVSAVYENNILTYTYEYIGDVNNAFMVNSWFEFDDILAQVVYFDISYEPYYSDYQDTTDIDLFEQTQNALLKQGVSNMKPITDGFSNFAGLPTSDMAAGLNVLASFMGEFFNISDMYILYRISLYLGMFGMIAGIFGGIYSFIKNNRKGKGD